MTTLIKACLNGTRRPGAHPALPLTPPELAADTAAAVAAGAAAVHVHPRDTDGSETLLAVAIDAAVAAIRDESPGIPVGVSTGAWIVPRLADRVDAIAAWREPDFASVNLSEDGHEAVMEALVAAGIGIEAGVWSTEDVAALEAGGFAGRLLRVLVEPSDRDPAAAVQRAVAIDRALDAAGIDVPRVHHGVGRATWAVLRRAIETGHGIRVGLEDTFVLPDGEEAAGNAELVAAAVALPG